MHSACACPSGLSCRVCCDPSLLRLDERTINYKFSKVNMFCKINISRSYAIVRLSLKKRNHNDLPATNALLQRDSPDGHRVAHRLHQPSGQWLEAEKQNSTLCPSGDWKHDWRQVESIEEVVTSGDESMQQHGFDYRCISNLGLLARSY